MSINKLEEFNASTKSKSLCGLLLKKGEKNRLYQICVKYGIPIKYPNLFSDNTHYSLWGISENGIGLIGTIIMNYLEENNGTIFYSLDELEENLKNKLFGCLNIVMIGILVNLLRKKENKHYIIFRYYHENWLINNLDKVDEIIGKIELESQKYLLNHKVYEVDEVIKYISQINKNIWVDFNVKNVYLFGSYGKCKQDEHSDIDVLLVLEKNSDSRGVVEGIISTILFNEFKIPNDIISIYEDEQIDSFTRGILKNSIKVF